MTGIGLPEPLQFLQFGPEQPLTEPRSRERGQEDCDGDLSWFSRTKLCQGAAAPQAAGERF